MEKNAKKYVDPDEPVVQKPINDLGIAAYLMMHGFKVVGRKNRTIFFEIKESDINEVDDLCFEYLSSPYHQFDSWILTRPQLAMAA